MKKHMGRFLILLIALMMAMPAAVFATTPPPANATKGTMSVEYRYTEGETIDIPDEITRFGFRYYKVSQSEPVLESTLPQERTLSFNINGLLTKAQLDLLLEEDWGPGKVTVTPKWVPLRLEMDVEVPNIIQDSNDVSDLDPGDMYFTPDSVKAYILRDNPTGATLVPGVNNEDDIDNVVILDPPLIDILNEREILKNPEITGVEFFPVPNGNEPPLEYSATVVYRGHVQFSVYGFSEVGVTYRSDEKGGVNVYIITAEYESDELPAPIQVVNIGDGGVPLDGGGLSPEDQALVNAQSGNLIQDIAEGYVPLGNTNVTGTWSLLSMILSVAALAIAAIYLIGMFARRKREEVIKEYGEDSERLAIIEKRASLLRTLTIIVGAMTIVMWLYTDDLSLGVTWINMFTQIAVVLFGATVVLLVFTKIQNKKAVQFIKGMFIQETSVAS